MHSNPKVFHDVNHDVDVLLSCISIIYDHPHDLVILGCIACLDLMWQIEWEKLNPRQKLNPKKLIKAWHCHESFTQFHRFSFTDVNFKPLKFVNLWK